MTPEDEARTEREAFIFRAVELAIEAVEGMGEQVDDDRDERLMMSGAQAMLRMAGRPTEGLLTAREAAELVGVLRFKIRVWCFHGHLAPWAMRATDGVYLYHPDEVRMCAGNRRRLSRA